MTNQGETSALTKVSRIKAKCGTGHIRLSTILYWSSQHVKHSKKYELSKIYLSLSLIGKSRQWEEQQNFRQPCAKDQPGWKEATNEKDVLV